MLGKHHIWQNVSMQLRHDVLRRRPTFIYTLTSDKHNYKGSWVVKKIININFLQKVSYVIDITTGRKKCNEIDVVPVTSNAPDGRLTIFSLVLVRFSSFYKNIKQRSHKQASDGRTKKKPVS